MFKNFLKQFVPLPTPEEWAEHNARKTSADEIIVANILQSFVSHFDDWQVSGTGLGVEIQPMPMLHGKHYETQDFYMTFTRNRQAGKFAPKIEVKIRVKAKRWRDSRTYEYGFYTFDPVQLEVNDIPIAVKHATLIYSSYRDLQQSIKKAREVAAKAKRDMELNEKRWDLVESLFGMKRTGTGVLTTVETAT